MGAFERIAMIDHRLVTGISHGEGQRVAPTAARNEAEKDRRPVGGRGRAGGGGEAQSELHGAERAADHGALRVAREQQ